MKLESVPSERLAELVEQLSVLRHDLGKYIGFEVRFVGEDPEVGVLRAALRSDLHRTRRDRRGSLSAWELWAQVRPHLLDGDARVESIEECLDRLREIDLDGDEDQLGRAAGLAREVGVLTRELHEHARQRLEGSLCTASLED
ncbi:MAG: hypothetical protein QGG40_14135 [Myxococcota bacterium]|nr:hypothetical protein [Myxococcota bacterium]